MDGAWIYVVTRLIHQVYTRNIKLPLESLGYFNSYDEAVAFVVGYMAARPGTTLLERGHGYQIKLVDEKIEINEQPGSICICKYYGRRLR
jgi:hypothetical protein